MIFKKKTIHAALFDMDGTMFDTERLRFSTLRQASSQLFGQPIGDDLLHASLGLGASRAESLAKRRYGHDYPYKAIRQRADELELAYVRKYGVPIKAGLFDVLERLKNAGLLLAVATSSRRAIAEEYLVNARVMKYFDVTVCGDEVSRGKPHPEIFLTAANELNCQPRHCLAFEDSENGLIAAAEAGTLPIAIRDIRPPRDEVRERAFGYYDALEGFLDDLVESTPKLALPALNEPFPQTCNELRAGIHGFGAMGGGYLTQVFSHWDGHTRPQEIIAASGNPTLRNLVNAFGRFSVHYGDAAFEQAIEQIRLIDSADTRAMRAMYAESTIIGLCLPESAIRQQAGLIGDCLEQRFEVAEARPLTLLVVLNKVGGAAFVRRCVAQALSARLPEPRVEALLAKVDFVETMVNRIVSRTPREMLTRQMRQQMHELEKLTPTASNSLQIELLAPQTQPSENGEALSARFGDIAQLYNALATPPAGLFHSTPDMPLYAQKGSPLLERLRQVRTLDDIGRLQTIKNKLLNGTHAIIAWYACLLGYRSIGQSLGDSRIETLARDLVERELRPAILHEAPELAEHVDPLIGSFLDRCRRSFKDPCQRVARDPLRKLQRSERILGSIDLARRHGLASDRLEYGCALGILYAIRSATESDKECRIVRELYRQRQDIGDVLCYPGPYHGRPYPGLRRERDGELLERIDQHFQALLDENAAHWDWPLRAAG